MAKGRGLGLGIGKKCGAMGREEEEEPAHEVEKKKLKKRAFYGCLEIFGARRHMGSASHRR